MVQSLFHERFNNSIITALLFNTLPLTEKERKIQCFVSENEERYDIFCDNIYRMFVNKGANGDVNTLYLTIDGFSFISNDVIEQAQSCFPVLTINKYTPGCPDISAYVDMALTHFLCYCEFAKNTILAVEKSA